MLMQAGLVALHGVGHGLHDATWENHDFEYARAQLSGALQQHNTQNANKHIRVIIESFV